MSNIFGTEHMGSYIKFPPGGEQHTFHLHNGVVVSAIRSDASYGNQKGEGLWEVYAWREHSDDAVVLSGADQAGVAGWLTAEQVGEKIREAAGLQKVGA